MMRFGIKNLRRLKSVEPVEIKPITLLVGRNSSGKSTFLRCFPLIRQSLMTRIRTPLLWWGEYVDFGTFQGAVHNNDSDCGISFSFGTEELVLRNVAATRNRPDEHFRFDRAHIEITVSRHGNTERISSMALTIEDRDQVNIHFDNHDLVKFTFNGRDCISFLQKIKIQIQSGSIFPDLTAYESRRVEGVEYRIPLAVRDLFVDLVQQHLYRAISRKVRASNVNNLARALLRCWPADLASIGAVFRDNSLQSIREIGAELIAGHRKAFAEELIFLCRLNMALPLVRAVLDYVRGVFQDSLYIGPARARSERYYRYQDLAVSEIDHDGKNFPMFLNSLSRSQLQQFSDWIKDLFGFGLDLERPEGHITINLLAEGHKINVADTGYGVSQVLPVLGQIWWARNRAGRPSRVRSVASDALLARPTTSVVSIEQPELHLHPAHQALIAEALVDDVNRAAQQNNTAPLMSPPRVHYLVETHSEALINRLGELIHERRISHEHVQILVFETMPHDDRQTTVRVARFDEAGALSNWPFDFFLPSD